MERCKAVIRLGTHDYSLLRRDRGLRLRFLLHIVAGFFIGAFGVVTADSQVDGGVIAKLDDIVGEVVYNELLDDFALLLLPSPLSSAMRGQLWKRS